MFEPYQCIMTPEARLQAMAPRYTPGGSRTHIYELNDDCLIAIFRYVGVLDLHSLSEVSPRCARIVKAFRSNCMLKADVDRNNLDFMRKIFENVGHHIETLFVQFSGRQHDMDIPLKIMTTIQDHCSATLRNLCIRRWTGIELHKIRPLLSAVRTIHLEDCAGSAMESDVDFIDEKITQALVEQRQVEVLSLIDCEQFMREDDLAKVFADKPQLSRLQIMTMSEHGFTGLPDALSKLPSLQFLTLHMDATKRIELTPLVEIETLRSLCLAYYDGNYEINEMLRRTLVAFKSQTHLEELVLHACRLEDAGYVAVGNIKSIRHLALRKHYWADDRIVDMILGNTKYRTVDLFDCIGITDNGILALLTACPELDMIDVSWCTQLSYNLVAKCYAIIVKRPRHTTSCPFELFVGGRSRVEYPYNLRPSDQGLVRLVHDPSLSVTFKPSRNMTSILDEIEREKMCAKTVRLPTNAQSVYRKDFRHGGFSRDGRQIVYICDMYHLRQQQRASQKWSDNNLPPIPAP